MSGLTVKEKISLLSGASAWTTQEYKSEQIPSMKLTDGANGVRNEDIKATCFPSPVVVASTFDLDLVEELGRAIGKECRYFGTNILLAPAINIKRSPLCGRNSGYYSEDAVLTGEVASSFISGVQSQDVGACVKHFAVYNQETQRMTFDAVVDEQTLHEVYLKGFEIAVKKSNPVALMTGYNKSNGVYSSENKYYLMDILRNKWGFKGFVVSDWGGVNNRVKALKAGLDLEMPISNYGLKKISDAYENGEISLEEIEVSVDRLIKTAKSLAIEKDSVLDLDYSKDVALKVALNGAVLLKNEDNILPITKDTSSVLVVGESVKKPRIQSGGCDKTTLLWSTDFITELSNELPNCKIEYQQGYLLDDDNDNEELEVEALSSAKNCQKVIFFISLPERYESEGYDRQDISLPKNQLRLLKKICSVNKNTVVILQNGAPVETEELQCAKAILESYLLGGIWGKAVAKLVAGEFNPCGKLAETFPIKLEDTPCYLSFPGFNDKVVYNEGLFVGYKYYLSKKIPVSYPFGFGLSYTKFNLSNIQIDANKISKNSTIKLSFDIENIGKYDGAEVVQVYINNKNFGNTRPVKELKKFVKCFLKVGETKRYEISLSEDDFACYQSKEKDFIAVNGNYDIIVGVSCVDEQAVFSITVEGNEQKIVYTSSTRVGEILKTQKGIKIVEEKLLGYIYMAMFGNFNTNIKFGDEITSEPFFVNVMNNMPLQALCNFSFGQFDDKKLDEVLNLLNN